MLTYKLIERMADEKWSLTRMDACPLRSKLGISHVKRTREDIS